MNLRTQLKGSSVRVIEIAPPTVSRVVHKALLVTHRAELTHLCAILQTGGYGLASVRLLLGGIVKPPALMSDTE